MNRVQVLMSTYNGKSHLAEQLDSILRQVNVKVKVLIRDDGSTDSTVDIIRSYQRKFKHIDLIVGENIGYQLSFMELVNCCGDSDYYAFADQDDVWEPNKLSEAMQFIANESEPCLYFSNCKLVDQDLNSLGMLHQNKEMRIPQHETALIQGFAHGCTMVFNKASLNLIKQYRTKQVVAHDFWIPLLHVLMGKVVYDKNSCIKYRQHSENVFGAKSNFQTILKKKLRMFSENSGFYSNVVSDLLCGYKEHLPNEQLLWLEKLERENQNFIGRMNMIFNPRLKRDTFRGTLFLKFIILFAKF